MSFVLFDLKDKTHFVKSAGFVWRPVLELIKDSNAIDQARIERMSFNANAQISQEEARAIAMYLQNAVLSKLRPGQRVLYDKTISSEPDDHALHHNPDDLEKNYSVGYDWLVKYIEFFKTCKGFEVS